MDTVTNKELEFNQIYSEQNEAVRNYLLYITPDKSRVPDLVQEVFLVAWRRIDDLRHQESQQAWLIKTAKNIVSNERRTLRRRGALFERIISEYGIDIVRDVDDDIIVSLSELPENHQKILLLHYLAGMSIKECAKDLKISESNAAKRLERARDKLLEASTILEKMI